MGTAPEVQLHVMRVGTRCRTSDEFIAAFSSLVDEDTILVLSDKVRPIGSRRRFAFELADGTPLLRGEAEVIEATAPPRARIRLRLIQLDGPSREIHERMLAHASGRMPRASSPIPVGRIPDRSGTGPIRIPRAPSGPMPAIPAIPPRVMPTGRPRADDLVPPKRAKPATMPEPSAIPEPVDEPDDISVVTAVPETEASRRDTTRMYGLAPPQRQPPAFPIEHRDTTKMAPLTPSTDDVLAYLTECHLVDEEDDGGDLADP